MIRRSSRCSKNRAKIRNMKNWHIQHILNSDKIQNVYRAKIQSIICFIPSATKCQVQLLTCENLTCHCHSADILRSLNWFIDFWVTQVPDLGFDNDIEMFYCTLYNVQSLFRMLIHNSAFNVITMFNKVLVLMILLVTVDCFFCLDKQHWRLQEIWNQDSGEGISQIEIQFCVYGQLFAPLGINSSVTSIHPWHQFVYNTITITHHQKKKYWSFASDLKSRFWRESVSVQHRVTKCGGYD